MCLGTVFGGWGGGFGGDAFKLMSESLEGTLAVLETFSPSGVRDSVFYQ